jgi:Zn finger protein HypA/HybF involved in hydrogenase expression
MLVEAILRKIIFIFCVLFSASFLTGCDMEATFTVQVEDKHYICNDCGNEFYRDSIDYNKMCPECSSPNTEIVK